MPFQNGKTYYFVPKMVRKHSSKIDLNENVLIYNPFSQGLIDCAISYITTPPHGMCCPNQKVVVKGVLRKGIPRNKSA